MLYFADPKYLYLLILVPFLFVGFGLIRYFRKKSVAKFADRQMAQALMPSVSTAKAWVRVTLFSIAFASFVIGIARPQIGAKLSERKTKGVEVMICLDVSNSMLAQDYSPCRLDRAKLAISRFVDKLQDDRIGLIVFAGQSFVQLPVTTDYVSAKMFLSSINTDSVPIQGTAIGEAIRTAVRSFSAQSSKSRVVIVITDGENHEDDAVAAAKEAAGVGVRVFTVGVGSPEGKPIPMGGELMKDKQGNIVVTKLDEAALSEIAEAGNGAYVRAGNTEFGLNPIIDSIRRMDEEELSSVVFEEFDEQYMYFFGFALLLLIIEMLVGSRKPRLNLFGKKTTAVLAFVLCFSSAFAQTPLDRKEVRKGNRDFRKENFRDAEINYRRALVKDSLSVSANYNLANTLYMLGDYESAGKYIETAETAGRADVYFNKGNIALQSKNYNTALEAFKQSLLKNPDDVQAKESYLYAKKMLENQQNQQNQNDNQNQDKNDDSDQNKDKNDNQDQNKDQNDNQNQNNDNNQNDNQDRNDNRQQPQQEPQLTPQAAQQMLQAIETKEKETQDKVKKEKALMLQSRQKEKNW